MAVDYRLNLLGGLDLGQTVRQTAQDIERREEKQKLEAEREQLKQAALGASKGDPAALESLFSLNPNLAMQFEQRDLQRQQTMSQQQTEAAKKAEMDWGIRWRQAKTPEQFEALKQEALQNPLIDFDEDDLSVSDSQANLAVNAMLYKNMGKDAYNQFFGGGAGDDGKTAAIKNYEYFTSIINDPAATKAQKDNARRQLGEIGRAGALPSSISYRDQDFILNTDDGKYYRALDNKTLDEVQRQEAAAAGAEVESKEIAKQRSQLRSEAIKSISIAQSKINSYDEAIRLIDQGASTERYEKALPTLKTATSMLESVRSSLALDTLKGVSLGALSEKEMEVLQETSIPSGDPREVKDWIVRRKEAERKLISMLKDQVIWMNENKGKDPSLFYIENGLWDGKKPSDEKQEGGQQPARQAPQAAIDYLMENPDLKEQFRQKYGYLPEGI